MPQHARLSKVHLKRLWADSDEAANAPYSRVGGPIEPIFITFRPPATIGTIHPQTASVLT